MAELLDRYQAVLADRACDSDAIRAWITEQKAVPVIRPHPTRASTRKTDCCRYKERAMIECLFGKMKHFRRVFSRFDKLARRYLAREMTTGQIVEGA